MIQLFWSMLSVWMLIVSAPWMAIAGDMVVIRNKGSDTMLKMADSWSRSYRAINRDVRVKVSGGGSGNGIAALINGHVDIANASRPMKTREIRLAVQRFGKRPVGHIVGWDAVTIFVHKNNPLKALTLDQLTGFYVRKDPRKKWLGVSFERWTDLGISVPGCDGQKIIRTGRKNSSGTYGLFRDRLLGRRLHFSRQIVAFEKSKDVVRSVEKNPCAIGYSGMGYVTSSVRRLCLRRDVDQPCVTASAPSVRNNSYPITRPLYMYTLDGDWGLEVKAYLDWVLSSEGQRVVLEAGYIPVKSPAPRADFDNLCLPQSEDACS